MKGWKALAAIGAAVLVAAIVVLFTSRDYQTTLDFMVRDSVSKEWVHDATITLQGKIIRSYFGKDYIFTHLKPGESVLRVSAPSYTSREVPVHLRRGENTLEEPIDLVGYEIPDLSHFVVFEDLLGNELIAQVRPVGEDGPAVLNHPCLDLRILVIISAQMYQGDFARTATETDATRGEELFRGEIEWRWDSDPHQPFRYSLALPLSSVKRKRSGAFYWVIDYLFLVPDPRNVTAEEMNGIVREIGTLTDPIQLPPALERYAGKLDHYLTERWNVESGRL